jgi:hypothetical protein
MSTDPPLQVARSSDVLDRDRRSRERLVEQDELGSVRGLRDCPAPLPAESRPLLSAMFVMPKSFISFRTGPPAPFAEAGELRWIAVMLS